MSQDATSQDSLTDETARALRTAWFAYVDAVEPLRAPLHAYGLRLTGNVWDAEDLVQETLLKGFAMIGRGDLHGPGSPVADTRAYMFRTASNLWIDTCRRRARERAILAEPQAGPAQPPTEAVRAAGERLIASAAPRERAAAILKDVFEFSVEEIADQLRTSVGGVKAALHRGRAALKRDPEPAQADPATGPSRALVDRFVDAFHSGDVARLTASLTETCSIEVPGVGGGRGRRGGWAEASVEHGGHLQPALYRGETVVLSLAPDGALRDIMRLEEADGLVSRVTNYCFCPDTLRLVGEALGLPVSLMGYHQGPQVLPRMIATTTLPWGEGMRLHGAKVDAL